MGEGIPQKASFHRKYVRGRLQVRARTDAVHCKGGRSALQEGLQCTASETGKTGTEIVSPILDRRKGREKRAPHGSIVAPQVMPAEPSFLSRLLRSHRGRLRLQLQEWTEAS